MWEYPKPISKECTQRILEQMNYFLFGKIKNTYQICFFTKINYKNINIPVLITNYDIINYIASNNEINIFINNELNIIKIEKVKYFNKDYNLAVIQIKDNIKINYLEFDNNLFKKEIEKFYHKESIYILNYNNKNDISVTYSIISNINNSEIIYPSYCNKNNYILPIFNLDNNKLIGIHTNNYKYYNKGLLFKFIINKFINEYKNTKIEIDKENEINILININKNDIFNKIYFLNSLNNNNIELNEKNTELYINDLRKEFNYYLIPDKKGEYNIKLKFNINLIDCSYMFANCENIIEINFIRFNTKYVKSMKYMFHKCKNLKYINNLLLFDTRNAIDMSEMFSFCYQLNNIDLSSFNINNVKNMNFIFDYCYKLKNIKSFYFNIDNINDFNDINIKSKIVPFNTKYNKYIIKYLNEIQILIQIKKDDINKEIYFLDNYDEFDWYNETKHSHNGLEELNAKNTELYVNQNKLEFKKYFIPKIEGEYNIKLKFNIDLKDCSYMFAKCDKIKEINFIRLNTSLVRNMHKMFSDCSNLTNLDLSSFDTRNVNNMRDMFYHCEKLNKLDLSSFNTQNVKDMSYMFYKCNNLNNLDLSSFDTKNVKDMSYMFSNCSNLNSLDLSSFITKNVINMMDMFSNCKNLKNLELSSFDTENVTDMSYMFSNCINLINLNLSSFDTKNVTNMSHIFFHCSNLNSLDLSSFDTKNVTEIKSMFYLCPDNIYELNKSKFSKFKKEILTELQF